MSDAAQLSAEFIAVGQSVITAGRSVRQFVEVARLGSKAREPVIARTQRADAVAHKCCIPDWIIAERYIGCSVDSSRCAVSNCIDQTTIVVVAVSCRRTACVGD